ncbi:MAG: DNA repair protein RadA [Acidimicrobiia bacterium]|nr:DNA repair protein RadA [Acidimicrobiia bacterium]
MTRTRVRHSCTDCGAQTPRWLGRCPECGAWNTLVEEVAVPQARAASSPMPTAVSINLIDPIGAQRRATGVPELDRVLDGGLVPGSVTLLVGEPGMGKSTLMLQALGRMAADGARCLLVSAEESCEQVRMRADRLGVLEPSLLVVSDTSLHNVLAQVDAVAPDVLAIDSIQTVHDPDLPGSPGSVTQVRECAQRLVRLAKERGISVVLVGHVTKDGQLAGPRALEHVVDTVLQFEGDRHHALRMLRALKHRFGSTHELGLFEMGEAGLIDVPDPSALFLTDRRAGLPGSIVAPVLEGARPLLVEVQALVNSSTAPMPRRSAQGLESSRLAMLLAVLDARAGVSVADVDVYASVAGGVRVIEAGADLAVAIAVASARIGVAVPDDLVAIGEIGLGGELRQAGQTPRRLAEAARLGFRRAIVPASSAGVEGIELIRVGSVVEALAAVGLSVDQQRSAS